MIEVTDQNFEETVSKSEKPVLVDFYAEWCSPCSTLGPILEKVAGDFEDKLIFAKANLDNIPLTAQKLNIDRIPFVVLFKNGKPVSGFMGVKPEPVVREILEKMLKKDPDEQAIEEIIKGYKDYAESQGLKLNPDQEVIKRIARGLLANERKYGQKYCPCRRVTGNKEEDRPKICPCAFHKEEIEENGHCLCNLFTK
jgi:thioredoxin